MRSDPRRLPFLLTGGLALTACLLAGCGNSGKSESAPATETFRESVLAVPADPVLATGQTVYRADCANCHDRGKKGAPRTGSAEEWKPRLQQGLDTLIEHATNGYLGPAGDEMPARGGNEDLTDEQIAAAVRYLSSLIH